MSLDRDLKKPLQKAPRENASGSWLPVIVRSEKYYIVVLLDGILSKHDLVNIISLTQAPFQIKGLGNFMVGHLNN